MPQIEQIPDVRVVDGFSPEEVSGRLWSPLLQKETQKYGAYEGAMWDEFEAAKDGSAEEEFYGRQLELFYTLKAADRVQLPSNDRDEAVQHFNELSNSYFGVVNPETAKSLMVEQLDEFETMPDSLVSKVYKEILGDTSSIPRPEKLELPVEELREAMFKLYPEINEVIDELPEGTYKPWMVIEVLNKILDRLITP